METALPNSMTVDSSCQGRPVRPLAPGSFRVEICDAGWTLGFLPLWDTQKGGGLGTDCWGLGWAVSGVRMAEAYLPTDAVDSGGPFNN